MRMLLDSGICTVFQREDVSEGGGMPKYEYTVLTKSWYGELDFETVPVNPNGKREDTEASSRIRIYQNRQIDNHTVVVLADVGALPKTGVRYDVTRAYHGHDDDNGQPITDLTLKAVEA
jgi:hypothetical protein